MWHILHTWCSNRAHAYKYRITIPCTLVCPSRLQVEVLCFMEQRRTTLRWWSSWSRVGQTSALKIRYQLWCSINPSMPSYCDLHNKVGWQSDKHNYELSVKLNRSSSFQHWKSFKITQVATCILPLYSHPTWITLYGFFCCNMPKGIPIRTKMLCSLVGQFYSMWWVRFTFFGGHVHWVSCFSFYSINSRCN